MDRIILHSDLNNFYASVECMLDPTLRGKPVAVCGSIEERHGIVLAKNYEAKAYGIQTGETVVEAFRKCPMLISVEPRFDNYIRYSRLVRSIYERYTDMIEPFGMDECWLDVTASTELFGNGREIAYKIKESVKRELGLTVSVGVSFNKIFAKLGSDMKKPDAVTLISRDNFKDKIWCLPASDIMGVGRATTAKLDRYGIVTIGQLANTDPGFLYKILKSHGLLIWRYANGYDCSPVCNMNWQSPIKSIGHGMTTRRDLVDSDDVLHVLLELAYDIGHKLRKNMLAACGVSLCIRDCELDFKEWQCKLPLATQSETYLAKTAYKLFVSQYGWEKNIRSVTLRAINLVPSCMPEQLDLFSKRSYVERLERIDEVSDRLRERFGEKAIKKACLINLDSLSPERSKGIRMPTGMIMCM